MAKLKYKTEFTFEFKYKGDELLIYGSFVPGEDNTRDTSGCADRFIIDMVKYLNGEDVVSGDINLESLEEFILETKI